MHFRTSFWLTLSLWVPAVIFCQLALWQLDRKIEKENLLETIKNAPAMSAEEALSSGTLFARVQALGRYDSQRHILLDNKIHEGRAGVHVFTPFTLLDGAVLLVDRGWLPMAADRLSLPMVPTDGGIQTITGRLVSFSTDGVRIGPADQPGKEDWPQLVTYLDPIPIGAALNTPLAKRFIQLDPGDPSGFGDRQWKAVVMGPSVHGAYAFQWFSLMTATIVLWFFLGFRRGRKAQSQNEE